MVASLSKADTIWGPPHAVTVVCTGQRWVMVYLSGGDRKAHSGHVSYCSVKHVATLVLFDSGVVMLS